MNEDTSAILKRALFAIIAGTLLAGCQTIRMEERSHIQGISFPAKAVNSEPFLVVQANKNLEILNKDYRDYSDERKYYPSKNKLETSDNVRPETGLALSGGGMRSAAFSIGVMSGLAEKKDVFESIDIISAVSGGSYALSWYYMQQYYMEKNYCLGRQCKANEKCEDPSQLLLKPDGPFQKRLAEHGGLTGAIRGFGWSVLDLLLIPVNFFCNGLFGMHTNTTISRHLYEERIEQTFHRIPEEACSGSTNGFSLPDYVSNWPTLGIKEESATFPALKSFIKEKKLPFFIINATVQIDDDKWHRASKLSNSVFEFTPLHLGSSGVSFAPWGEIQYTAASHQIPTPPECTGIECPPSDNIECPRNCKRESPPISVVQAVSISGAAVDSNAMIPGSQQKVLVGMLNQDLGFYLPNYNCPPSCEDKRVHDVIPFPFYFLHYYPKDQHGVKLYLSDGGHSENLGVFSLVRRLPQRIIVVDAEFDYDVERDKDSRRDDVTIYKDKDKYFLFEAYRKLKAGLKADMGVEFIVPGVEGTKEQPGLMKGSPYKTKNSCLNGYIGYFPYKSKEGGSPENACIDVTYIKLSIDMDKICRDNTEIRSMKKLCPDSKDIPSIEKLCRDSEDTKDVLCPEYPESIPKYVKERVEWNKVGPHCSVFGFACDFPQESTEDQSYTEKQFKAYRDLGKWIVENQCDFATRMCPDKTSVPRLVEELDTAMRQKDVTKAKVVLVKLHDILVRNANLEANSTKRTMSDDDLRGVLAQLRPLALKESQVMLVQPSQLKDIKIDVFQNYFVPFPQTPAAGEKVTSGTGGGGGQSRSRPRVGYGCDRMSCRSG